MQGFSQIEGVKYGKVFALVMWLKSLCTLFAIAATLDLEIDIIGIVGAYLSGTLDGEIYMKQPLMYEIDDSKVC